MAKDDKDIFALETPQGTPAYPKMVYRPTGDKHKNGADVMDTGTIVKNVDEHKAFLADQKGAGTKNPDWGK